MIKLILSTSTSRMIPSPSSPLDYQQTDTFWSKKTIPFESFDAVWYYDWREKDYYRLMITKGRDQLVLSVQGAKRVATIERFDKLIGNIVPEESSPDLDELRKLVDIRTGHFSHTHRLFPGHPDWNDAISLLAVTHHPSKEDHRLCPAMSDGDPCAIIDLCDVQRIFGESWMEETNQ